MVLSYFCFFVPLHIYYINQLKFYQVSFRPAIALLEFFLLYTDLIQSPKFYLIHYLTFNCPKNKFIIYQDSLKYPNVF